MTDLHDYCHLERLVEKLDDAVLALHRAELQVIDSRASAVTRILVAQALAVANDATRAALEDLTAACAAPRDDADAAPV